MFFTNLTNQKKELSDNTKLLIFLNYQFITDITK